MSDAERIATLEAENDQLKQQHRDVLAEMRDMRRDITEIKRQVTSWRGIVLGIVLTVSALWSVALGAWQIIKTKLGG